MTPPTGAEVYLVTVDRLPPKGKVEVRFLSVPPKVSRFLSQLQASNADDALHFHILGTFQFELRGAWVQREFLVPLLYDPEARRVRSLPCEEDTRERTIRISQSFG